MNYKKQCGFTLLEVLVAITLLVVISIISYTGLNGLIDSKIQTDQVAETLRREVLTSRQLHKDIKSIINRDIKKSTGELVPTVIGSYYSIEFSLNGHSNPLKNQRSELQRVKWNYSNGQLIRSQLDYLETGNQPRWKDRLYLNNLKDFNIRYINNSGQKVTRWPEDSQFSIPKIIQITLVLDDDTSLYFNLTPNGMIR